MLSYLSSENIPSPNSMLGFSFTLGHQKFTPITIDLAARRELISKNSLSKEASCPMDNVRELGRGWNKPLSQGVKKRVKPETKFKGTKETKERG